MSSNDDQDNVSVHHELRISKYVFQNISIYFTFILMISCCVIGKHFELPVITILGLFGILVAVISCFIIPKSYETILIATWK